MDKSHRPDGPEITYGSAGGQVDQETYERFAARLAKSWPEARDKRLADMSIFRGTLDERFGAALHEFPMLHLAAAETLNWAQEAVAAAVADGEDAEAYLDHHDVLVGLTARALLVFDEVTWLLVGGYPSGAWALCRTLHELWVASGLLVQFGSPDGKHPDLVERFVVHREVFYTNLARDISASQILDPDFFTDDMMRRLDARKKAMLERYGRHFGSMWGWAAPLVPGKSPTIANLAPFVYDGMGIFYSLTSDHVHAGSAGWHGAISGDAENPVRIASATDSGLQVPAQLSLALLMGVMECVVPTRIEIADSPVVDKGAHFMLALGEVVSRTHDALSAVSREAS